MTLESRQGTEVPLDFSGEMTFTLKIGYLLNMLIRYSDFAIRQLASRS